MNTQGGNQNMIYILILLAGIGIGYGIGYHIGFDAGGESMHGMMGEAGMGGMMHGNSDTSVRGALESLDATR